MNNLTSNMTEELAESEVGMTRRIRQDGSSYSDRALDEWFPLLQNKDVSVFYKS